MKRGYPEDYMIVEVRNLEAHLREIGVSRKDIGVIIKAHRGKKLDYENMKIRGNYEWDGRFLYIGERAIFLKE